MLQELQHPGLCTLSIRQVLHDQWCPVRWLLDVKVRHLERTSLPAAVSLLEIIRLIRIIFEISFAGMKAGCLSSLAIGASLPIDFLWHSSRIFAFCAFLRVIMDKNSTNTYRK